MTDETARLRSETLGDIAEAKTRWSQSAAETRASYVQAMAIRRAALDMHVRSIAEDLIVPAETDDDEFKFPQVPGVDV